MNPINAPKAEGLNPPSPSEVKDAINSSPDGTNVSGPKIDDLRRMAIGLLETVPPTAWVPSIDKLVAAPFDRDHQPSGRNILLTI